MPVSWSDQDDAILAGDLAVVLSYCTPAGGAAAAAVAPIGLRDRERGEVTFTTSLGLGRKLDRIRANPRIALASHAREHGFATGPRYVLVEGESAVYAPHTEAGFRAPANKTLLLLGNGLMAKRGLKKARATAVASG